MVANLTAGKKGYEAADAEMKEAAAVLPIRVQGGETLSTRLLDLPAVPFSR